jgi:integration host factor subunit beta
LTRSELIAELAAANTQLRGEDVETIVATIFDGIAAALATGRRPDRKAVACRSESRAKKK